MTKLVDEVTCPDYGYIPEMRPLDVLLNYGVILVDKPPGPTSHEVVAWIKRILNLKKAGHSGTLDPGATGLLPVGLGEATKALGVLHLGAKEYYVIARLHSVVEPSKLNSVFSNFLGQIYQRPPQRSSVRRATRIRCIYELTLIEKAGNLVLCRTLCQAGTYVRKLIYDIGEVLGPGATMLELRRTRVSNFREMDRRLIRLHDIVEAFQSFKETGEEKLLRNIIRPVEECLQDVSMLIIKDSAVDAICHGAQLAVPGIVAFDKNIQQGQLVGIYTLKGELVALGDAVMTAQNLKQTSKGIACHISRVIMKPGIYPRCWKT